MVMFRHFYYLPNFNQLYGLMYPFIPKPLKEPKTTKINDTTYNFQGGSTNSCMYLLIGDERALLIDTGFGVSRLDEALNWVYDQVPFIFRHLMYQEIKHAKNTPTVPVKPFPEEGYFELGNRKVTFFDTPGHTPGSYLHPTILPSSFPPTIKSAAPFLHSKHLSFVILQLMEYTIYDYLIALDSK